MSEFRIGNFRNLANMHRNAMRRIKKRLHEGEKKRLIDMIKRSVEGDRSLSLLREMMGVSRPWRATEPTGVHVERAMSLPKPQSCFELPLEFFMETSTSPGISAKEQQDEWDRQDELFDDGMIIKLPMILSRTNSDPNDRSKPWRGARTRRQDRLCAYFCRQHQDSRARKQGSRLRGVSPGYLSTAYTFTGRTHVPGTTTSSVPSVREGLINDRYHHEWIVSERALAGSKETTKWSTGGSRDRLEIGHPRVCGRGPTTGI